MADYPITLMMACWSRPENTRRALDSIRLQTLDRAEIILIGDGCPDFQREVLERYSSPAEIFERPDWNVQAFQLPHHTGSPAEAFNVGLARASGAYICFLGNDDWLMPNHLEAYIESAYLLDFSAQPVCIVADGAFSVRVPSFEYGQIGHAELCVRTELMRAVAPHDPAYGHDWRLVENLAAAANSWFIHEDVLPTYIISGHPDARF